MIFIYCNKINNSSTVATLILVRFSFASWEVCTEGVLLPGHETHLFIHSSSHDPPHLTTFDPVANIVSTVNLHRDCPPSLLQALASTHLNREIWLQSYYEEKRGIEEMGTFRKITSGEYRALCEKGAPKAIPTMCVLTIKKDKLLMPLRAKSRIVVLGNRESCDWSKSDRFAPVLWFDSVRFLVSLSTQHHQGFKQGDCKKCFLPRHSSFWEDYHCPTPFRRPWRNQEWILASSQKSLWPLLESPALVRENWSYSQFTWSHPQFLQPLSVLQIRTRSQGSLWITLIYTSFNGVVCWWLYLFFGRSSSQSIIQASSTGMDLNWFYGFSWMVPWHPLLMANYKIFGWCSQESIGFCS